MKTWIILFDDGTLLPIRRKPRGSDYTTGSRFFEVSTAATVEDIQDWLALGCPEAHGFKEAKS